MQSFTSGSTAIYIHDRFYYLTKLHYTEVGKGNYSHKKLCLKPTYFQKSAAEVMNLNVSLNYA